MGQQVVQDFWFSQVISEIQVCVIILGCLLLFSFLKNSLENSVPFKIIYTHTICYRFGTQFLFCHLHTWFFCSRRPKICVKVWRKHHHLLLCPCTPRRSCRTQRAPWIEWPAFSDRLDTTQRVALSVRLDTTRRALWMRLRNIPRHIRILMSVKVTAECRKFISRWSDRRRVLWMSSSRNRSRNKLPDRLQ